MILGVGWGGEVEWAVQSGSEVFKEDNLFQTEGKWNRFKV